MYVYIGPSHIGTPRTYDCIHERLEKQRVYTERCEKERGRRQSASN